MKCSKCNGSGKEEICFFERTEMPNIYKQVSVEIKCDKCNGTGEIDMTNEEWFDTLSTKEKAKVLGRVSFCDFCPYQLKERCAWTTGHGADCIYGNVTSEDAWLAWLKEVHK